MASQTRPRLAAESRPPTTRKSDLHRLRREGWVPASLYGHGEANNIRVPERELNDFLRRHAPGSLLDLEMDGGAHPAILRNLDKDGVTGRVVAIGFQRVDMRETIHSTVSITFHGEEALVAEGLVLARQMDALDIVARADQLPPGIVVDVSACEAGTVIRIADLPLPEGVETSKDPELPVATVSTPTVPADVAAELDAEEAAHAAAAGEETEAAAEKAEPGEAEDTAAG